VESTKDVMDVEEAKAIEAVETIGTGVQDETTVTTRGGGHILAAEVRRGDGTIERNEVGIEIVMIASVIIGEDDEQ